MRKIDTVKCDGWLPLTLTGAVTIDGEAVTGPDNAASSFFQERGVFPWLSVEGTLVSGYRNSPLRTREPHRPLCAVGRLQGFEHSYPSDLSGGMKQRLQVARRASQSIRTYFFLDEPFGALDSITRVIMRGELLRIWQTERRTSSS